MSKRSRMEKSPYWKGGRWKVNGYICLHIPETHPFYAMSTHQRNGSGEIMEHRLIMAEELVRCLTPREHVHHINGQRDDNRKENLELISQGNHILYRQICVHCHLRKENRSLRRQLQELQNQLPTLFPSE